APSPPVVTVATAGGLRSPTLPHALPISSSEPAFASGQFGYVQRPSSIGPDSPRRLSIDPGSPTASVAKVLSLSTTVQLAELKSIAKAFLAEVVEQLNGGSTSGRDAHQHATFAAT